MPPPPFHGFMRTQNHAHRPPSPALELLGRFPFPRVILRVVLVIPKRIHGTHDSVLMHAFNQVVVPYQIPLVGQGVVIPQEHEGGHVPVQRVVLAVEENLRDNMAGTMAENAIAHSNLVEQV